MSEKAIAGTTAAAPVAASVPPELGAETTGGVSLDGVAVPGVPAPGAPVRG
ncbi:MAG: hypothetical protein H7323_08465 [Frankiales bacterium]|nr:hypothetical protein [Frankiales bacterium]